MPFFIQALIEYETHTMGKGLLSVPVSNRSLYTGGVWGVFIWELNWGETRPKNKHAILTVEVISTDFPKIKPGDPVLFQGNYPVTGKKSVGFFHTIY